jgi:hypothetical protein
MNDRPTFTVFAGNRILAAGAIETVAKAVCAQPGDDAPPQIFDDATGRLVELDPRRGPAPAPRLRRPPDLAAAAPGSG